MADIVGGKVIWNLDIDSSNFDNGIKNASNKAKELGEGLSNSKLNLKGFASEAASAFDSIANSLANTAKYVTALTIGGGGIGAIFLKSAADLQQTSKSFEVLTGNVKVANKLFSELAQYANTTPFEFPQIAKAGKTLLGFGISADNVMGDIRMLGDIAAATGADFGSLAVVFGQVNATGRLMGQDALQLINNNIPITTILAKKLGKTVQDVKADMEAGKIGVDLFNEALAETTQKGGFAFKGTDILAQSLNGRLSTLKDTVLEFGRNLLGVKIDPQLGLMIEKGGIFDRISEAIPKITKSLTEMTPAIKGAFDFLVDHGKDVVAILGALTAVFIAAKVAAFGFWLATLPISLPVLAIVSAVLGLVGVLTYLELRFHIVEGVIEVFKNVVKGLGDAFNSTVSFIKNIWESLLGFFSNIGRSIVNALVQPFKDAWSQIDRIAQSIKEAANKINPFYRNSPSLVDNVKRGIGIIADEFSSLNNLSFPSIAHNYSDPLNTTGIRAGEGSTISNRGDIVVNNYINEIKDRGDIDRMNREMGFQLSTI